MMSIVVHAVRRRRLGLLGWSLGLIAVVALVAVSYPAVRGNAELDRTFAQLSPAVRSLLGLTGTTGLTSPAGYLDSQFFANLLPLLLLVFGIGVGAWAIAGDEDAGTLELLLANPVGRGRVALARFAALAIMLAGLAAVALAVLLLARSPAGLAQVSVTRLCAAVASSAALGLVYAAIAFTAGAVGAQRGVAIAVAGGLAVVGFVLEGIGEAVTALRPLRAAMPWHWLLGTDPLRNGLSWQSLGLPLALSLTLAAAGISVFVRRDLR